ncbi:MAG: RNA polymerase sigma factor [Kofleriaceae bacterium]
MSDVLDEQRCLPNFREVYTIHAAFVWRVVQRLGVPATDVGDVCQEVFLVVHQKLSTFEQRSAIRTWLYGIAVRCASNYRRRAHVSREVPSDPGGLGDPVVEPVQPMIVGQHQARALLDRILDTLDEDRRAVFVLYELEELTMPAIAEILGCPLQTAYSRLNSARATFEAAAARFRAKEFRP